MAFRAPSVPVGIGPPNVLQGTISADSTTPTLTDLTKVTAVSLLVQVPFLRTPITWTATIVSATAPVGSVVSTLVWQHAFGAGDAMCPGVYVIVAQLSVSGGIVPCDPVELFVTPTFGSWSRP